MSLNHFSLFFNALTNHLLRLSLDAAFLLLILMGIATATANAAQRIQEVTVSENSILLLDARLNNNVILSTLEAYPYENTVLVAIEPLFDALKLRYQIFNDKLILWREDESFTFPLQNNVTGNFFDGKKADQTIYRFNDGYFEYLDINTLANFFNVPFETNRYQLRLDIKTQEKGYLFPLQLQSILEKQRILAAALVPREEQERKPPPITIDDQYQLLTMPNGRVSANVSWDEEDKTNNYSLQLASDLLYHAADMTLNKPANQDLTARLRMSRYKTRPDEYILGAFDSYSWGDVSGFSNNLTTSTKGGLGLTMQRSPENFRRKNLTITLQETAPPGWEAELFRNNQFIQLTTVPSDGLLTFEDVLTEYGNNYFQIKLYSPYGDVQIIERYYDLSTNALSEDALAYNLFAFDANHRLIDDPSEAERDLTDFGVTMDYGIYDHWQIGFGFANTQSSQGDELQFYSMKNAFTLPGMLLENDSAVNNDGGYAQLTSLIGNAFGNQRFSISVESAENYSSARINASEESYSSFSSSLGGSLVGSWSYNINASYFDQGVVDYWRVSNSVFTNFSRLYFSHTLNYFSTSNIIPVGTDILGQLITQEKTTDSITGQLGISGKLLDNVRASGSLNYDPELSNPILDNSSLLVEWNPRPFDINNYLTARYQPLSDSDNNWQLGHRILWDHRKFQFIFSSSYDADDRWTLDAGIRFFLGYDQYNNRAIVRNYTNHQSATLEAHAYLDRQANGIPDPLDYNLEGVEFIGAPDWEGITSGETGRAVLPGAVTNGAFYFGAKWKNGADTINKDYVVYTHPGARLDINMPFYLSSEIFGFVERAGNNAPMSNVKVTLKGLYSSKSTLTDTDGFFEFTGLQPDQYEVRIDPDYLRERNFTSDIVGYRLTTPDSGGFVELDIISLERMEHPGSELSERVMPFQLTINNSDTLIQEDNPRKKRNYFNLPVKDKLEAPHVLPEPGPEAELPEETKNKPAPKLDSGKEEKKSESSVVVSLPTVSFINKQPTDAKLATRALPTAPESTVDIETQKPEIIEKPKASGNKINKPDTTKQTGKVTIQLGAFKLQQQAETLAESFKTQPENAEVHQSGGYYRVIIGRFMTKEQANLYSQQYLKGKKVYVRERNTQEMDSL